MIAPRWWRARRKGAPIYEAEWLACDDLEAMLNWLCGRPVKWVERFYAGESVDSPEPSVVPRSTRDRQFRLFAATCVRFTWYRLTDDLDRQAVEVGERYADGLADEQSRNASWQAIQRKKEEAVANQQFEQACWRRFTQCAVSSDMSDTMQFISLQYLSLGVENEPACRLLRDIIGNPFRPLTLKPVWHTATVVALAHAAYDHRLLPVGTLDPTRLAILADALEEAGCANAALLSHLRSPGPHVRGCWALDLILGKEDTR